VGVRWVPGKGPWGQKVRLNCLSPILTAFLISFFPITVNIATGLATLEPELEDVLRVLGAKRWDVLVKVGLPRSMPYFYGSLKIAITLAFAGLVSIGAMAMAMYELFSWIEKRTTGWAHRGTQGE